MKRNNKGFTLAELLIVVAIIAVLVAVAVPTFNNQLEKSRQSTDLSDLRGAYAVAKIAELTGEVPAYDEDGNVTLPVKIGSTDIFTTDGSGDNDQKYSAVAYAFLYDADSGVLYPWDDGSNSFYANGHVADAGGATVSGSYGAAVSVSSGDNSIVKTKLKARSTRIVVDTGNLPGANAGLVQYGVRTSAAAYNNLNLCGDTLSSWQDMKIIVEFTNDGEVWSLKSTSAYPAIRFENVGGNTDVTQFAPHS